LGSSDSRWPGFGLLSFPGRRRLKRRLSRIGSLLDKLALQSFSSNDADLDLAIEED